MSMFSSWFVAEDEDDGHENTGESTTSTSSGNSGQTLSSSGNSGFEATLEDMRSSLTDPITMELYDDPVVTSCGHTFSRATLESWLSNHATCPLCNGPDLTLDACKPNYALRDALVTLSSLEASLTRSAESHKRVLHTVKQLQDEVQELTNSQASGVSSSSGKRQRKKKAKDSGVQVMEMRPSQLEETARVVGLAYADTPHYQYILGSGSDSKNEKKIRYISERALTYATEHGRVFVATDEDGAVLGASLWSSPVKQQLDVLSMIKAGLFEAPFNLGLSAFSRSMTQLSAHENAHTRTVDILEAGEHWSLYRIGVRHDARGKGVGQALLRPVLQIAADSKLPVFAIAQDGAVDFLLASGFHRLEMFDSPTDFFTMWAEPWKLNLEDEDEDEDEVQEAGEVHEQEEQITVTAITVNPEMGDDGELHASRLYAQPSARGNGDDGDDDDDAKSVESTG